MVFEMLAFFTTGKDECSENNGGCAYRCHNLIIGYRCSCREGDELAKDNKTCQGTSIYFSVFYTTS